jgi:peptidyl-prolyl cis-trans isomerase B (cyclophilin B)
MKRSKRCALLALAITLPLLSAFPSAQADENQKPQRVKCKNIKAISQSARQVAPPTSLLKRAPKMIMIETNCGEIKIRPNFRDARVTLTALMTLINSDYYNSTICHRLTTDGIYVVQCGDPSGTGYGDPGFSYRDENLPLAEANNYPRGTVAMANSGRPRTNGSQFFLVYDDTSLPPNYTIWGQITSGLEILEYIAAGGVRGGGTDGAPLRNLVIEEIKAR